MVGSGGKTTLIGRLFDELEGLVIRTTTTHILPPDGTLLISPNAAQVERALDLEGRVSIGCFEDAQSAALFAGKYAGKLTKSDIPVGVLSRLADYVLIEADGSRNLPAKAPSEREPVVVPETAMTIAVAGMTALGRPIRESAHRPEIYARLARADMDRIITPEIMARVLTDPMGSRKNALGEFITVLNQADDDSLLNGARQIASMLSGRVYITCVGRDPGRVEYWRDGKCSSL